MCFVLVCFVVTMGPRAVLRHVWDAERASLRADLQRNPNPPGAGDVTIDLCCLFHILSVIASVALELIASVYFVCVLCFKFAVDVVW